MTTSHPFFSAFNVPSLSVEDIDKKIADLRLVEGWLETNAGLLRTTIQSLEVQRNTLVMLQSFGQKFDENADAQAASAQASFNSPAQLWNSLQEQFAKVASAAMQSPNTPTASNPAPKKATTDAASKKAAPVRKRSAKPKQAE